MSVANGIIKMVRPLSHLLYLQRSNCGISCNVTKCWKWDVSAIYSLHPIHVKYAVLILNRPLSQTQAFMKYIWNNACVRITIDGGTLSWDTFVNNMALEEQKSLKLPDLITGDFDSITDEISQKYKNQGCKVKVLMKVPTIYTPDQNYTDFTKAVMELDKYCTQHEIQLDHVIAFGQTSGRLDQILGNIQTLFLVKERHLLDSNTKFYLMSDDAVSWLLFPGNHVITVPEEIRKNKRAWCSLVPMGETCYSITTNGLKWDLDKQSLKFGELVSTSNAFSGSELVKIKCSNTLLWSMKIPIFIS